MRIDPTILVSISDLRERTHAPAGHPTSPPPAAVVALGEAASSVPSTRVGEAAITAKIAQIREELAAGSYVVDLDQLSERILDDDVERGSLG